MGLLERMQQENIEMGIVPSAHAQHSKYLTCQQCGEEIYPTAEGWQGRYTDEGIPVYEHSKGWCPEMPKNY